MRTGAPLKTAAPLTRASIPLEVADRFEALRPTAAHGGCIEWDGTRDPDGYGRLYFAGRTLRVHRISYALYVADIPAGMVIDHLCRNRPCLNHLHLECVTPRTNTERGGSPLAAAVRATSRGFCVNGHELAIVGLHRSGGRMTCAECGRQRVARYNARRHEKKDAA